MRNGWSPSSAKTSSGGRSGDADGRERGLVLAGEFPAPGNPPGNPPGSAAEAGREA
ncbi:hypothetical protein ACIPRD_26125 [Streptomyces sp. NPDC090108]|uniref:hypothetical protein n=1 Tax=Streptomyces sp. NPDC090108 TaxID=3365947 RepID=UPI0037F81C15